MRYVCCVLFISLFITFPCHAIDVSSYGTVTLSKQKEVPTPFCPVTKISDNDKCMNCHAMRVDDNGKTVFTIKPAKFEDNYSLPFGVKLVFWMGKWVVYYENTGTDADKIEQISQFMYKHSEFDHFVMEMNSFGGSVMNAWRAVGILEEMRSRGITITTICYGKIASAGTILFVAGDPDRRFINPYAEVMIHKVWTFAMFDLKDPDTSQDQTNLLKHLQGNINDWFVSRTKLTHEIIEKECFKRDWWMTGKEAFDLGIATRIVGSK